MGSQLDKLSISPTAFRSVTKSSCMPSNSLNLDHQGSTSGSAEPSAKCSFSPLSDHTPGNQSSWWGARAPPLARPNRRTILSRNTSCSHIQSCLNEVIMSCRPPPVVAAKRTEANQSGNWMHFGRLPIVNEVNRSALTVPAECYLSNFQSTSIGSKMWRR